MAKKRLTGNVTEENSLPIDLLANKFGALYPYKAITPDIVAAGARFVRMESGLNRTYFRSRLISLSKYALGSLKYSQNMTPARLFFVT